MSRNIRTEKWKAYIRENYLKKPSMELAEDLGCSKSPVLSFMKDEGLVVPKALVKVWRHQALRGKTILTAEDDAYIIKHYLTMPVKPLAKKLGVTYGCVVRRMENLGLKIPKELREKRKAIGMFKEGQEPFNKGKKIEDYYSPEAMERVKTTWFKKGHVPANYNGGEFLSKDGYVILSIGEGKQRLKHIFEWEKLNGPLPKGYCLRCRDGNILNTEPSNWMLITRAENMRMNSIRRYPDELAASILKVAKIKKLLKTKYNEQIDIKRPSR